MLDFFASAYFVGILIMGLGCVAFLTVFFPSYFESRPRRFWIARLTYDDDEQQQSFCRFMWIMAWIFTLLGSVVTTCFNPHIQYDDFWWGFTNTLWGVILVWALSKAIIAFLILIWYIGFGFIRLKQWVFNNKPLFGKYQNLKPLNHKH